MAVRWPLAPADRSVGVVMAHVSGGCRGGAGGGGGSRREGSVMTMGRVSGEGPGWDVVDVGRGWAEMGLVCDEVCCVVPCSRVVRQGCALVSCGRVLQ